MKNCLILLIFMVSFFAACRRQEHLKAMIFERKELKGNRIMLHYRYAVNDKVYADSATMPNIVINSDSISVIIDPANPQRSLPDITK